MVYGNEEKETAKGIKKNVMKKYLKHEGYKEALFLKKDIHCPYDQYTELFPSSVYNSINKILSMTNVMSWMTNFRPWHTVI